MDSLTMIGFLMASMAIMISGYFGLKEIFVGWYKKYFAHMFNFKNVKAKHF